jgi:hypothetical protein
MRLKNGISSFILEFCAVCCRKVDYSGSVRLSAGQSRGDSLLRFSDQGKGEFHPKVELEEH